MFSYCKGQYYRARKVSIEVSLVKTANTYDPCDRGKRGEEWLIFLSEIVDEVQKVKKSESVCGCAREREKERKERPSIRKRGKRRERERECYWLMSTGGISIND